MLLDGAKLQGRWTELLSAASHIDVAVAWITSLKLAEDLVAFESRNPGRVRVVAGFKDNITSASCLRALQKAGIVKMGHGDQHTFHPKLFLFSMPDRRVCWVGSANLTTSAFSGNIELVHEYVDDGSAADWFRYAWHEFRKPTSAWIEQYESLAKSSTATSNPVPQMPPPSAPDTPLESWDAYYSALWEADKVYLKATNGEYGVITGKNSWCNTIRVAQGLMNTDWSTLSKTEGRILMGLHDEEGRSYAQLGSMQGAGTAKNVFLESTPKNLKIRGAIQDELRRLRSAHLNSMFPTMALKAHEVIANREGFSTGVPTRLLALARPEVLVSVNSESVAHLSQWSNLPTSMIYGSKGYEKLVRWVLGQPWWNSPEPSDPVEREIWSFRAALIDVFAYQGEQLGGQQPIQSTTIASVQKDFNQQAVSGPGNLYWSLGFSPSQLEIIEKLYLQLRDWRAPRATLRLAAQKALDLKWAPGFIIYNLALQPDTRGSDFLLPIHLLDPSKIQPDHWREAVKKFATRHQPGTI